MLRPAAPARPAVALSLLAVGALALVGCGGGGGEASSPSSDASSASPATVSATASPTQDAATSSSAAPSTAVSTASSSAASSVAASASADASESASMGAGSDLTDEQEERVEALEDVLLTPETAPGGVFTGMETQAGGGEPISTSLSLTGVTPTGACADLIEQINTQQAPGLGGALAQYEVDPAAVTGLAGSQAGAFGMVAVTDDGTDLLAPFGKLADTCGTFGDPDGVQAAFTKVPGVPDAVHIALGNSGMDTALFTMTVGGVTDGDELVYLGMVGLDEEIAAETLRAQVEAFEARER